MSNRGVASVLLAASVALAACGGAAPTPTPVPTPSPTPAITPIPLLPDQTTAEALLQALARAGIRVTPNNADSPGPGKEPLKRINATYLGWPMIVSEFSSVEALRAAASWKSGAKPGQGDPPISFAGLNLLVEWGPRTGARPESPTDTRAAALGPLATTLHALMGPLRVRSTVDVPIPTAAPDPEPEETPGA